MTKDDFLTWKSLEVTQRVYLMCRDLVDQTQYSLANTAGIDPIQDRMLVGYIKGLNEILNMTVYDFEELEND